MPTETDEMMPPPVEGTRRPAPNHTNMKPAEAFAANFNPEAAALVTAEGITTADENADNEWKERAMAAVRTAAECLPTITTDDVWEPLGEDTRNNSAMGPIMLRAAKEGIIKSTTETRVSRRASRHHNRLRVWRSQVYQGETSSKPVRMTPADAAAIETMPCPTCHAPVFSASVPNGRDVLLDPSRATYVLHKTPDGSPVAVKTVIACVQHQCVS